MAKTPTKDEIKRLSEAGNYSYRQLANFRRNDIKAMRQYLGAHYSGKGSQRTVPFNLLELAVTTYKQRLSGGKPRILASTKHQELLPQCAKLQRGTNQLLDEIKFGKTLGEVVMGAFFSMGIMKSGLDLTGKVEWNGYTHDVTQPFADSVTLDNWVHDMTAKRDDKSQFEGDRYCMTLDDAKERFDGPGMKDLRTLGDKIGGEADSRMEELSQGESINREYYRDMVEVWDIWDWRENRVISVAAGDGGDQQIGAKYLGVVDWNGPENGPYGKLKFNPVRGNIMPLPPVALWMDLHGLANNVMRKLTKQAKRQKFLFGVKPGGQADGQNTIDANDGDMIFMNDPKNVMTLNYPGIDAQMLAMLIQTKQFASWLWGNLDALGGLSPQSETLGQDRLLTASASQRLIQMEVTATEFATDEIRKLSEYLYTDPFIVLPQTKRYDSIDIPILWTPEDREADFLEYNIELEPYSLQYRSPSERVETLRQILAQLVLPFSQQLGLQGIQIDFEALFKIIGEYTNLPELERILVYADPNQTGEGPVRALQSPSTTRTNVRVNRPGATSQGKEEAMIGQMLGMGQQNSQVAQITRGVG